ncbi:MAG: arsenate reductase ArsC [Kordiimonadaceae bacterium]|nr:arsenate reductase ArsC [Kordiimonadaceae bacterium]
MKNSQAKLPTSILFICNFNAVRSPMAEAITKNKFGDKIYVDSIGVNEKLSKINPFAVAVMAEMGIDIANHKAQDFDDLNDNSFDLIIAFSPEAHKRALQLTEGHSTEVEYWPMDDPTGTEGNRENILSAFRTLRDKLVRKIDERLQC